MRVSPPVGSLPMVPPIPVPVVHQPTVTSCGPTCLYSVYRFHGDAISLETTIAETDSLEAGGTLGVMLGLHALRRGYRARIHSYNLRLLDPSWFRDGVPVVNLADKLRESLLAARQEKDRLAMGAYIEFVSNGGEVRMEDLTGRLLRRYLSRGIPLLTGLSATWLYGSPRERPDDLIPDDLTGEPTGHFVVLSGFNSGTETAWVCDPYKENPIQPGGAYEVGLDRLITAILLGVLTYDANLLAIELTDSADSNPPPP